MDVSNRHRKLHVRCKADLSIFIMCCRVLFVTERFGGCSLRGFPLAPCPLSETVGWLLLGHSVCSSFFCHALVFVAARFTQASLLLPQVFSQVENQTVKPSALHHLPTSSFHHGFYWWRASCPSVCLLNTPHVGAVRYLVSFHSDSFLCFMFPA